MVVEKRDGLSLAKNVSVQGEGDKTVILAHGYGAEQSFWEKVFPHLAQTHQVVVFDWDFEGPVGDHLSSLDAFAEELISLVESLKSVNGPLVYVGHSMSGMVGCLASIRRPDLFERLILVGASPKYLNEEDYEGGFEREEVDDMLSYLETNFQAWTVSFASMVMNSKDPLSVEKFEKSLMKMRPDVALSLAKTIFYGDLRDMLGEVEVPCTIVQTTNDAAVPMFVANYMHKKIKGDTCLEMIEADTHCPQLAAHQSFISVLDKILSLRRG